MDVDNSLLEDWEDESFVFDDELAIISSPQSQFASSSDFQLSKNDEKFLKSLDEDLDFAFALSLQAEFIDDFEDVDPEDSMKKNVSACTNISKPMSIVDDQWELIDPHPDIHALFQEYDKRFFYGKLVGVEVRWSPRMTLCAGVCCYEGRGGLCSVRLSVPLLKLRPRRDLVETLLHEMIHAYLFVTHNNKDREGHGPEFLNHMHRINKETGTRISVYHSFHDEVDVYRQHWWKCDGPCKNRRPFFGLVKRAMNRAPGPKDNWWAAHQASCNGKFIKIKEPENKKKSMKRKAISELKHDKNQPSIKGFFKDKTPETKLENHFNKPLTKSTKVTTITTLLAEEDNTIPINCQPSLGKTFVPFKGTGHKLGGTSSHSKVCNDTHQVMHSNNQTQLPSGSKGLTSSISSKSSKVSKFGNSSLSSNTNTVFSRSNAPATPAKTSLQGKIEKFLSPKKQPVDIQLSSSLGKLEHKKLSEIEILNETVLCPVCVKTVELTKINSHLDECIKT